MLEIEFKLKLNAITPTKAYAADAGFDLYAIESNWIQPHKGVLVDTGVSVNIPEGYVGLLFSRSGMGTKGIRLSNCVGVIDSGYHGWIGVMLHNDTDVGYDVRRLAKVAQLVIVPIPQVNLKYVNDFSVSTDRGDKGFGSSG